MDERRDSGEYYPGGRSGGDAPTPPAPAIVVDEGVTKDSANPVKSSGIWGALWGAIAALPAGTASLYDWCVAQLAGKLNTDGYTSWRITYPVSGYKLLSCNWYRRVGVGVGWAVELLNVPSGEKETFYVAGEKTITEIVVQTEDPLTTLFRLVREKMCKTKTSELTNDGDGVSPFATVSQIPDISGKASAADLRYALVTADVDTMFEFPASMFPVVFTTDGTTYTITRADDLFVDLLVGEYRLKAVVGESGGVKDAVVLCTVDSTTGATGAPMVTTLTFNGESATTLTVTRTATLADRTGNLITAQNGTASIDIELPEAVTVDGVRYCRDFLLDVDNSANASDLALEFTAFGVEYAFVPSEDDSISEMTSIGAGERVRLYLTETPYTAGSLPVIQIARCTLGDFVTSTTGGNS